MTFLGICKEYWYKGLWSPFLEKFPFPHFTFLNKRLRLGGAPPSLSLLFKNVKWGKGNFSKKGDQSPLYQYSLQIPRNVNQKEVKEKIKIKLDFTRVPDYKIRMIPAGIILIL